MGCDVLQSVVQCAFARKQAVQHKGCGHGDGIAQTQAHRHDFPFKPVSQGRGCGDNGVHDGAGQQIGDAGPEGQPFAEKPAYDRYYRAFADRKNIFFLF